MTVWWLSDDCVMTVRWLSDDCLMTVRWLSDELMTVWWLFDHCLSNEFFSNTINLIRQTKFKNFDEEILLSKNEYLATQSHWQYCRNVSIRAAVTWHFRAVCVTKTECLFYELEQRCRLRNNWIPKCSIFQSSVNQRFVSSVENIYIVFLSYPFICVSSFLPEKV